VLAPIPLAGTNTELTVDQEQLPNEATLRPRANERSRIGEQEERTWTPVRQENFHLDFNALAGGINTNSVATPSGMCEAKRPCMISSC
jgi:hypothetical protein